MQELFNFIQDSYDPKYSNETDDQTTNQTAVQNNTVVNDINASTTQSNVTTQITTIAPVDYDPSLRVADNKASTTVENEDKGVPLYEINNKLQQDLFSQTINYDVEYATGLFKATGQNPTDANGKPIDVSKLSELFQDPKQRKAIMDIAHKLEDDPNLSVEDKWNAQLNTYYANGINNAIPLIQSKIWEQMYSSAMVVDAQLKARKITPAGTTLSGSTDKKNPGYFGTGDEKYDVAATDLFVKDKEGKPGTKFVDVDQFSYIYLNRKIDQYNQFIKKQQEQVGGASSVITNYNRAPYTDENGVRHVMNYNKMNEQRYKDAQEDMTELGRRMQMAEAYKKAGIEEELDPQNRLDALKKNGLPQNWRKQSGRVSNVEQYANTMGGEVSFEALPHLTPKNFKATMATLQGNLHKLGKDDWANDASVTRAYNVYNKTKERIVDQYNKSDNTAVYKIKAELEDMFKGNKGGETQTPGGAVNFNWNSPYRDIKKRKSSGYTNGIENFTTVLNYANYDNGTAIYSYGGLRSDNTGKFLVPERDKNVAADIIALSQYISADISSGEQQIVKGKHATIMLPQGSIEFSRKIFDKDGNEYAAFNVKLNPNYLNQSKYKGTQENPMISAQHPELVTAGYTIYVPSKIANKTSNVVIEAEKADILSNTEINLGLNGTSTTSFKGAGQIDLQENKENRTITMSGYTLNFNPSKNAYDTNRIQQKVFQKNQWIDIDRIMDQNIGIIKGIFIENENSKRDLLQLKGVKDPNLLQQNKQ